MASTKPLPSFFCSITLDIMRDPVTAEDGHSYERAAIERWFCNHSESPKNGGGPLSSKKLIPNHALRNAIEEWREANCKHIPRSALTLGDQIGSGSFKKVFKSMLQLPGSPGPIQVAALQVRSGDVGAEAEILLKLGRHPRLVHFIGQVSDPASPTETILITEYAPLGALTVVLEQAEISDDEISIQHKLVMMQQVASGMEALAEMNLFHRDLAIRNVLVFALDVEDVRSTSVKVSDFGLTVNGYTATHKYVHDGPKPFRWLSPEALKKNRYSEKSDVWAFGVTCWELLEDGDIPFYEITNDDAITAHVTRGGRLKIPDDCPKALADIIESCWSDKAKERPTFAQLCYDLSQVNLGLGPTRDYAAEDEASANGVTEGKASADGADCSGDAANSGWNMRRLLQDRSRMSARYATKLARLDETTSSEFMELRASIEGKFSRGSKSRILLESVYKVKCIPWDNDFERSSKALSQTNISTFLHGTGIQAVDGILSEGFRLPTSTELEELRVIAEAEANADADNYDDGNQSDDSIDEEAMTATKVSSRPAGKLRFGPGVYFTTDVGKAAFFSEERDATLLLVCDVAMGSSLVQNETDPLLDAATVRRRGHDSVTKFSDRDTGRETEAVIYDPNRAIVRYLVVYRSVKLQTVERQLRFETRWQQTSGQSKRLQFSTTNWRGLCEMIEKGSAKERENALDTLGSLCRDDCAKGARNLDTAIGSLWKTCFEIVRSSPSEPIVWFTLRLFHNYAFNNKRAQSVLSKAGGVKIVSIALQSPNEAIVQKAAIAMCNMSQACPQALAAPTGSNCIQELSKAGSSAKEDLTKIYVTCALRNFLASQKPIPPEASSALHRLAKVTPKLCAALKNSGYRQEMWLKSSLDFLTNLWMNVCNGQSELKLYQQVQDLHTTIIDIYTRDKTYPVCLGDDALISMMVFMISVDRPCGSHVFKDPNVQDKLRDDFNRLTMKVIKGGSFSDNDRHALHWISQNYVINRKSNWNDWQKKYPQTIKNAAQFVKQGRNTPYRSSCYYIAKKLLESFPKDGKIGGVSRKILESIEDWDGEAFEANATGSIGDTLGES